MRLREVKRKIEELGSDGKISISLKQQIGNYYMISDNAKLFHLLLFLSKQEWNDLDFANIQGIIESTDALKGTEIMLNNSQYNQLVAYVNKLNERLPIFFGMVSALSSEQGEFDINIKLSDKIHTVDDLFDLISQIKNLEKFIDIDGQKLNFAGFDTGSWWITLSAGGAAVYGFIMSCVKLAQEVLKTQEQYYKTKEAKIHYQMTLKKDMEVTEDGLKEYCQQYCEKYLEDGADEIAKKLGEYNGASENEIGKKAKSATEGLVSIIGDGNEVHISLNSNNAIKETSDGSIKINYDELRKLRANDGRVEPKQLEASSESQ